MSARLARAEALAAELRVSGVRAYLDPAQAGANLPAVLVPPPILAFDLPVGATATWRLVALAADPTGSRGSWAELDELVETVAAALPVERAEPTTYVLPTGGDPLPAYSVTLTESVD